MDVGVIKDLLTHDIDSVRWLSNDDYSTVHAHKLNIHPKGHEDAVIVVARTRSGILINHEVNWISPIKERKTTIYGELGVIVIDSLKAETTFYASGRNIVTRNDLLHLSGATTGEVIQFSFDKHEPLRLEHENFRDRVLGKEDEDTVLLSFARRNVEIADEILISS
jgi:predicted dehydrogenase